MLQVPVRENDVRHTTKVRMEGVLKSGTELPKDAQIVFYQTCTRKNDFGVDCTVTAGIATLSLAVTGKAGVHCLVVANPVVVVHKSLASDPRTTEPQRVTLRVPSAGWIDKGQLLLRTSPGDVKIDGRIKWESTGAAYQIVGDAPDLPPRLTPADREMMEYTNRGTLLMLVSCTRSSPVADANDVLYRCLNR